MNDEASLRLDKWLWYARFCKSRSLAQKLCMSGKIRLDGTIVSKAHHLVRRGQVLTFPLGPHIRVVEIVKLGIRRGPAAEARTLYVDLAPPLPPEPETGPDTARRDPGAGRPTKSDRRALDRLRART